MNKLIKVFTKGAVIILIAAPFLVGSKADSQDLIKLKLKDNFFVRSSPLSTKIPAFLPELPLRQAGAGMTIYDKIAALTPFARKEDSLKSDSNITVVKPKDPTLKKFRMRKSPTTAVLLSAIIPGAGQFYNESYWKIPIIGGLVGYFGYEYFRNNNLYKDYKSQYAASQTELNPNGDFGLKTLREFYRDQRDDFVWYFLIVYVVGLVDAYVDAHLFDFDVSEDKFTKNGTRGKEYRLKFKLDF
jgi:TM2 domain-containing membrane protein YozV